MIKDKQNDCFIKYFVGNCIASCLAETFSFPFTTIKIRRQIYKDEILKSIHNSRYEGFKSFLNKKDFLSLYAGIGQGYKRQLVYNGVWTSLYSPVRNLYGRIFNAGHDSLLVKTLASTTIVAFATGVAQPLTFLKIRLQANKLPLQSVRDGILMIRKDRPLHQMWHGAYANMLRASLYNVSDCISYDLLLKSLKRKDVNENYLLLQILATAVATVIAVGVSNPIDVVKTRYIQASVNEYNSILDCIRRTYKLEGFKGFYRGSSASYCAALVRNVFLLIAYGEIINAVNYLSASRFR